MKSMLRTHRVEKLVVTMDCWEVEQAVAAWITSQLPNTHQSWNGKPEIELSSNGNATVTFSKTSISEIPVNEC